MVGIKDWVKRWLWTQPWHELAFYKLWEREGKLTRKRLVLHRSGYLGKRFEQRFPVPGLGVRGSRKGFQQVVMGAMVARPGCLNFYSSVVFTVSKRWKQTEH